MALTQINARVSKGDDRPSWEKILDAALKTAQLTGAGFDIVNSIKTSKLNQRKQNVDEGTTFEVAAPGEEGVVTLPESVFGKNVAVKPRDKEADPYKGLQFTQLKGDMDAPDAATSKNFKTAFPNYELPSTQKAAQEMIRSKAQSSGDVSEREKFSYQKEKDEYSKKKQLTPANVMTINEGNAIPGMLTEIEQTLNENADKYGPVSGRVGQANPYDTDAQVFDAKIRAASQSFGRFMEGGVLRKEDEMKYRAMFPNMTDTADVRAGKLKVVDQLLRNKQASDLKALEAQGYDLTGLDLPANTQKQAVKGDVDGDGQISEAEKWVMDNPDDPGVPDVLKRIKLRKGLGK